MRRLVAISHGLVFVIALAGLASAGTRGGLLPVSNSGTTNTRGIGGAMPAYYDASCSRSISRAPPTAEATVLARNTQFNNIYQYDPGLPGGAPFVSVIDAITADGPGFNPLWLETQLVFNPGFTPEQFKSDDEIRRGGGERGDYAGADDRGLPLLGDRPAPAFDVGHVVDRRGSSLGYVVVALDPVAAGRRRGAR